MAVIGQVEASALKGFSAAMARQESLVAEARAKLLTAMERHSRIVLAFSGGEASLICLDLLADHRARIELVWSNSGAALPAMREFVLSHDVKELRSNQAALFTSAGIPARIVPVINSPVGRLVEGIAEGPRITDWPSCCRRLLVQPIFEHLGQGLLITGQRLGPTHYRVFDEPPQGIELLDPLRNWTDADVLAYSKAKGLALPSQYDKGYANSIECANCPALVRADRFQYLAAHHPESWESTRLNLGLIGAAVRLESEYQDRAFAAVFPERQADRPQGIVARLRALLKAKGA